MKILVTGGAGFIASALIRFMIKNNNWKVYNIDKLTYAANLEGLEEVKDNPNYYFKKEDICNREIVRSIFDEFKPNAVMHLAAESHVDNSIKKADDFIKTNIEGTYVLLDEAKKYWASQENSSNFRFIHVSTDEVYGSLKKDEHKFTEKNLYAPNSPYSASKASSDLLARAWYKTYNLPIIITHCSNNYGAFQNAEKLIPLTIGCCLNNKMIPIFGTGENIRDWIYVDDHVKGLLAVLEKGEIGEVYNMGGGNEKENLYIIRKICTILDELHPRSDDKSYLMQMTFIKDRLGHDFRYAVDNTKIETELGWKPEMSFEEGIFETIKWYLDKFLASEKKLHKTQGANNVKQCL